MATRRGLLFVVSAPSGAGKTTIVRLVAERDAHVEMVITATTRDPRPGEVEGKDYYFLAEDEFRRRRDSGAFAEWAEVHGHWYGTPNDELNQRLATGNDVILQVDVQGMRGIKALRPDAVTIFVMPPSLETLEQRLAQRGANTLNDTVLRVRNASAEMAARNEFDYNVMNMDLNEAVAEVEAIIREERQRAAGIP